MINLATEGETSCQIHAIKTIQKLLRNLPTKSKQILLMQQSLICITKLNAMLKTPLIR
jgi:hypothetical protein